ncbi:Pogo transposable element with, partial [Brachionus plicatilis]
MEYLNNLNIESSKYPKELILNMDETPFYLDMTMNKTIDKIGSKTVDIVTTGNEKSRFTVVLTITAGGQFLAPYIIFRRLKKVPKVTAPDNFHLNASYSGTMDQYIMIDYIDKVIKPYLNGREAILDQFKSHYTPMVESKFINEKIKPIYIPPSLTSSLQPLDVSVNAPIKTYFRNEWSNWMDESVPIFTAGGNRKKPSYQQLINMLENAVNCRNKPDLIKKAFTCCGYFDNSIQDYLLHLNPRLKQLLFLHC